MITIPKRIQDRISQRLKPLQAIVQSCKDKDVSESDTVTLVMDVLCDLLGYDKYGDLTKEHQIKSTYCDIAIQGKNGICSLIECKAIGKDLKENHTQQAINYAVNKGCEWVFLTNGAVWKVYKVVFGQPVEQELVIDFDLLSASARNPADQTILYVLSKEGFDRNAILDYYKEQQAKDRFCIAAVLQTEPVLTAIRRELRNISPGIKITNEDILAVMVEKVIKRELLDGERACDAVKTVRKSQRKRQSEKAKPQAQEPAEVAESVESSAGDLVD